MDHSQRGANPEASNATSASSSLMPNVIFREIHKNAFLKRHSSDRRTGFPRKSEKVWVVFCVHDDVEPFLEIYPDQNVALTHKPEWFASLSNALHVSPTICGHEDEFEFAVTLSFQVVRLAAPSWNSMMEWVETIRNKLRELKVLCPKENLYSKMPEHKQALLPTRDPNSPLPLPPEGPSTLLPGVELVHLENRNGPTQHSDGNNVGRNQRDANSRNNIHGRRANTRRENSAERETRSHNDTSHVNESSSNSDFPFETNQGVNVLDVASTSVNLNSDIQSNNQRVKRTTSVPQPEPSTSNILSCSNITVIEVSTPNNKDKFLKSAFNFDLPSDNEDDENEFSTSVVQSTSSSESVDETHYDHVFPSNSSAKPGCFSSELLQNNRDVNKSKKKHLTSVLISPNNSNIINSSQPENTTTTSSPCSAHAKDILMGNSTCVNLCRYANANEADEDSPLSLDTQSKLEKVNISGLIPRVPAKTSKAGVTRPVNVNSRDSNLNVLERNKSPVQIGNQSSQNIASNSNVEDVSAVVEVGESSKTNGAVGFSPPAYSQVKKTHKIKVKSEDLPSQERHSSHITSSPVLSKRKQPEVPIPDRELRVNVVESRFPNSNPSKSAFAVVNSKPSNKIISQKEVSKKKPESANNININEDVSRHVDKNQSVAVITNNDNRDEPSSSTPSTSGNRIDNSTRVNIIKNDSVSNCNNNPEIEPIVATVQPAIGGITVEDIPLIGGHQRRRRRSSSSDSTPTSNVPSSRGIGGADRIRINVPLTSNPATRDAQRKENESRSSSHSRNGVGEQNLHVNVPPQSSRLTLREQQVLQLRKEMMHPGGVRLQLRKKDCLGSIALVDVLNGVWIAGWKQKEHPLLYNALHIGDQLISVGEVLVRNSVEAQKLIRSSNNMYIEFIIRRVPFGNVFTLQRSSERQDLGIVQEGNTAEIKDVLPNSIAARQGLTPKTPTADKLSLTTWFLTEINARPLNLFFKDNEVRDRLNAVGKDISILVQPHDFIKQIKKQLKNMRSYKEYIVQ